MTIRQLSLLCAAAYYNPPRALLPAIGRGEMTLGMQVHALLWEAENGATECGPIEGCGKALLLELIEDPALTRMKIVDYINKNQTNGFVAYGFRSETEGMFLVFRGSESKGKCVNELVDWKDNFTAPFEGSVQYPDIECFVNRYRCGALTLTGHSKGGHNAMYALMVCRNERAKCVPFNGQGFAFDQLSAWDVNRLKRDCAHYVVQDDPVGILLMHPEPHTFVQKAGSYHPHELCSFLFDACGEPVPGKRPLWSYLVEGATAAYVNDHILLEGAKVPGWLVGLMRIEGMA